MGFLTPAQGSIVPKRHYFNQLIIPTLWIICFNVYIWIINNLKGKKKHGNRWLLMFKQNKISFHSLNILILGFFFYLGTSVNAIGQEGRGIIEPESSPFIYGDLEKRPLTDPVGEENKKRESDAAVHEENKPAPAKSPEDTKVKKEGMSTLSFNLLLYVVDKFREDK